MHAPPVIVFDLDGTLVDTAPDLLATLNAVLAPEGFDPISSDEIIGYVGRGARVMIERVYTRAGRPLPPEKREALFDTYLAHYDAHIVDASKPYAGAEPRSTLRRRRMASRGRTNKLETPARKLLGLLGLSPRFAA